MRLLTRHSRDDCRPPPSRSPDLAPAEAEVHSERSPIADDRRGRRRFATGPTRYPAKRVPGRVPELDGPCRHLLFPRLKSTLRGRRLQTIEGTEGDSLRDLHAVPQNEFRAAFQNWNGPCRHLLFPRLKSTLRGRRLQTRKGTEGHSLRDLHAVPQIEFQQ
jgi:hypothetical protein